MRRAIGCEQWQSDEMEPASVWVERSDRDELRIEVIGGSELFMSLDQARELADLITLAIDETWLVRR